MVDVVGYVRVSTDAQGERGAGLEVQRRAIREEAERREWRLVEIYEDVVSGKSMNGRHGLHAALEALRCGEASVIVVAKLDRLSRSLIDFAGLVERSRREGWAIVALDLGVDLTTAGGEMLAGVLAVLAQWERRMISERTKAALAVRRAEVSGSGQSRKSRASLRNGSVASGAEGRLCRRSATGSMRTVCRRRTAASCGGLRHSASCSEAFSLGDRASADPSGRSPRSRETRSPCRCLYGTLTELATPNVMYSAGRALPRAGTACETASHMSSESELGQLLELLYGAHGRFRTARGVLSHRYNPRLIGEAMEREVERANSRPGGARRGLFVVERAGEEPLEPREQLLRFWWEPPDRLREEVNYDVPDALSITVRDGGLWWVYSPQQGAVSNAVLDAEERRRHGTGGGEMFVPLLEPSGFLVALEFGEISRAEGVLRVRARPRRDERGEMQGLLRMHFRGADELELEVDAEVGIVRRQTVFFEGKEMSSTELTELVLDEALPEDTFVFVPPPGEEVLPPESAREWAKYMLEEAAAEAPFTVFYVPDLPEGHWRLQVHYHAAPRRPPGASTLSLLYSRSDGRQSLALGEQAAADARRGIGWPGRPLKTEEVERDGVSYLIGHANPKHDGKNQIVFERDGTGLQLWSELEVETLLELAASLQPVQNTPGSP
jgi:DNA invertase Pin-like site-specific DNA recombinase